MEPKPSKEFNPLRMEKKEREEVRRDPIALFLERLATENKAFADIPPSTVDFSYLSPEQKAESLWAVFQDVKGMVSGRKAAGGAVNREKMKRALGLLKQFYDDPETRRTYQEASKRYLQEIDAINGNREKYQALTHQIRDAEGTLDAVVRGMFRSRGHWIDESDILLFETTKRALETRRHELRVLLDQNPELGGLAHFEMLKTYARELRRQNFIWSPSRREALEAFETAALSGKPVLLSGESGTGKTRLVEQAALTLTGRVHNETPGKDVRFQDLIAKPKIGADGRTYYEYKEIGEAFTGRTSTLDEEPAHDGRVVADDEFNLLAPAEQTERMARIAAWTPGKRVRMPVTNEELTIANAQYVAMVNLASQRYERKKIPPEVLRKFAKVDLDYPPQSALNPELYEMLLAALIDENGRMRVAKEDVEPHFIYKEETKTIARDGRSVTAKVKTRELQDAVEGDRGRKVPAGGFLWRFARALHELNNSFSHRETVLKSKGEGQFVRDLIIDIGVVLGWLREYGTLGRGARLEGFIAEKLKTQFLDRDAYTAEDRALVRDFLKHFGIDVDKKTEKTPEKRGSLLTALDVGLLSPRVKYEKIVSEEPEIAESYWIDEEGNRVAYYLKSFEMNGKQYAPGDLLRGPDGKTYEFHGVTKDTGEPILSLHNKKAETQKPKTEAREGDVTLERAAELMGQDYLGPEAVEQTFGVRLESHEIPPIPFTEIELERAKELGQFLILRVDHAPDGTPLTMQKMHELLQGKFEKKKKGKVLFDTDWYKNEEFFTRDTPKVRWALVSKEVIPNSTNKNYLEQTQELAAYLKDHVFKDQALPQEYDVAITEFEAEKQGLATLISTDWQKAAEQLANLKLNQLTRQIPAEVIYDLLMYFEGNGRLLGNRYTWTSRRSAAGALVRVGRFAAVGASVSHWDPGGADGGLGVSFSRSL